ncbi:hypothetical protein [Photorhabdus tasmaniensis]
MNDWYGAMGNSNMKVSVRGYVDKLSGKNVFIYPSDNGYESVDIN